MPETVLIQGYTPLIPLIERLQARDDLKVALWENFAKDRLHSDLTLERFIEQARGRQEAFVRDTQARLRQVVDHPVFRAQFQWHGKDILAPVQNEFLEELTLTRFMQAGVIEGFRRFWEEHQPRLVILSNDTMHHTKLLTHVAQQLGVPVLHVLHGSPAEDYGLELYADHLAVFGTKDRDKYVRLGGNGPERITVTGAGAWDYCASYRDAADREAIRARLGIPSDRPCVLFLSSWVHWLSPRIRRESVQGGYVATLKACRKLAPMTTLVRPHPAVPNSGDGYLQLANSLGVEGVRLAEGELREFLVASDVVLCFDSNAGVEALLLDRPVITLRFPPWRTNLFAEEDGVAIATDDQEVEEALRRLLTDEAHQGAMRKRRLAAIPRFNHLNDGHALDRLNDLVDQLLAERVRRPPQLAVAMRSLNQLAELQRVLPAWAEQEVVVVDDGSTDGSREWLSEQGIPWVAGGGTAADEELAWQATRSEWLLWADGPVEPVNGRWERLMVRLHDPQVGAVAPQVIGENGWAGIGWFQGGRTPFGRSLAPEDERAQQVWRVGANAGGVRLLRRGGQGEASLYCPGFQVKAHGWEPDAVTETARGGAPVPLW